MRLIVLSQPNCDPCERVKNHLAQKSIKYTGYNVYDNPEKAAEFGVMGVPVLILLDNNEKEIARSVGFKQAEIDNIIEKL